MSCETETTQVPAPAMTKAPALRREGALALGAAAVGRW